jgi:hypothetical protein
MRNIARYYLFFILQFALFFSACDSKPKKIETATENKNYTYEYKRFIGKIAGKNVVVNLSYLTGEFGSFSELSGNYYYVGESQVIDLTNANNENNRGFDFCLQERLETDINKNSYFPEWRVNLRNGILKGSWIDSEKKEIKEIDLFENYENAYPFNFVFGTDSVEINNKENGGKMKASYALMIPSADVKPFDASFINETTGRLLGGDSVIAGSIYEYVQIKNKKDFKDYLGVMAELMNENDHGYPNANNWESYVSNSCRYNDNQILVFEISEYSYSGGAHGFYLSQYLNLDMKQRKVLQLSDIMNVDTMRLCALLDTAVRSRFGIDYEVALSDRLLVDSIPLTTNFAISDIGICFYYNVYEIASFNDGKQALFVPYSKREYLLTPDFIERMNIYAD